MDTVTRINERCQRSGKSSSDYNSRYHRCHFLVQVNYNMSMSIYVGMKSVVLQLVDMNGVACTSIIVVLLNIDQKIWKIVMICLWKIYHDLYDADSPQPDTIEVGLGMTLDYGADGDHHEGLYASNHVCWSWKTCF